MRSPEDALILAGVRLYLRERRTGQRDDAERDRLAAAAALEGAETLRRVQLAMQGSVGW